MKFLRLSSLLIFSILLSGSGSFAQNTKHSITNGKIVYRSTLSEGKEVSHKSTDITLFIKKDMSRVEMDQSGQKMVIISDNLANTGYMLMDNPGMKMAMKIDRTSELKKKGITKDPKIVVTRESKVIAGYTCYKAIMTTEENGVNKTSDVWFTSEIKGNFSMDTKVNGINGLMMEFQSIREGKTYTITATSVDLNDNLSDDLFKVPSDYQIMDMKNFKPGQYQPKN